MMATRYSIASSGLKAAFSANEVYCALYIVHCILYTVYYKLLPNLYLITYYYVKMFIWGDIVTFSLCTVHCTLYSFQVSKMQKKEVAAQQQTQGK